LMMEGIAGFLHEFETVLRTPQIGCALQKHFAGHDIFDRKDAAADFAIPVGCDQFLFSFFVHDDFTLPCFVT